MAAQAYALLKTPGRGKTRVKEAGRGKTRVKEARWKQELVNCIEENICTT